MSLQEGLLVSLLVLATVFLALLIATAAGRAQRRHRDRRDAQLIAAYRPIVLELIAGDVEQVRHAARVLAEVPKPVWRALEPMVRGMLLKVRGDSHAAVAQLLQRRGVIERSMRQLHHRRIAKRAFSAELLGAAGARSAVPQIISLLSDPAPEVRVVAARALGRIGDQAAVAPLFDALVAEVPARVVATALCGIEAHDHADLRAALRHPEPMHRAIAAEVAGLVGAAHNVEDLVSLLDDVELEVRIRAARALGRIGLPTSRVALERVTGPLFPPPLRVVATRALGELGDPSGLATLLILLDDEDPRVAEHAANGLLACGPYGTLVLQEAVRGGGRMGAVSAGVLAVATLRGLLVPSLPTDVPLGVTVVTPALLGGAS